MSSAKHKPKLSKGILEMKFMKRTKEKVEKEDEIAEGRKMYSQEITSEMLNDKSTLIIEPSFNFFENLIEGRLSFRGMNPELERLMELENSAKIAKEEGKMEADVSDSEMKQNFENNLALTIEKKFKKKTKHDFQDSKNRRNIKKKKHHN